MASFLHALGRASFRRRWLVLALWTVLLAGLGAAAAAWSGPASTKLSIPGTEAQQAMDALATEFPAATGGSGNIVVEDPVPGALTTETGQQTLATLQAEAEQLPEVAAVLGPEQTGEISRNGTIAVLRVQFTKPVDELDPATKDAFETVGAGLVRDGLTIAHGGDIATGEPDVGSTEGIGVLIATAVLAITLGSLVAAGMTLLTALIGVAAGMFGIIALSGIVPLNATTPILALMLGLAVGIDYSLFITSRYRHNLLEGMAGDEAAGRAVGTAGSAVVFAGSTVIIALAGLSVVGIDFLTKMGLAAAFTVAVAVVVSLTLSPALLSLAGRKALPRALRTDEAARQALDAEESPRLLGHRWAEFVTHHRILAIVSVLAVLGTAAVPALSMQTALTDPGHSADGAPDRVTFDLITKGFGVGSNGPLLVTVRADDPADLPARTAAVTAELTSTEGVAAVSPPQTSPGGQLSLLTVIPTTGPSDAATAELVDTIRQRASSGTGATVQVTGFTAIGIDISDKLAAAMPRYLLLVVGLSFILLIVVFRSILVPLKATLGFLLTIAATFGLTVAVFQWGWLADTVGLDVPGPLMSFLPILMIGILFGLAMDYEVFLVSRMREDFVHGASAREATVSGFGHGARVVTAAAIIMSSVFAAFAFGDDPTIKSMGFAQATGIAIDAFLVRMTLVPAVMSLLGDSAWWLPRWLGRLLPDLDLEGKALREEAEPKELADAAAR
jgi:putative drug exporter of the RND superfamily